jgi:hypothetical protein
MWSLSPTLPSLQAIVRRNLIPRPRHRARRVLLHVLQTRKDPPIVGDSGVDVGRHQLVDCRRAHGNRRARWLAEYERELIPERTALKRASARANATKFGRPRKVTGAEHIAPARPLRTYGHIARYLGVGRSTLYRYLAEVGTDRG